jgi:hypothetical protein
LLLISAIRNLTLAMGNFHCTPFEGSMDSTPAREISDQNLIGW